MPPLLNNKHRAWFNSGSCGLDGAGAILTRDQSAILEKVLSRVGIGIVVTDKSGEVLQSNTAAEKLLGPIDGKTPPGDWPRKYGVFQADGVTRLSDSESPIARAILGEEAESLEVFIFNHNSTGRWCSLNYSPLREMGGTIEGAVLILQDITERKKLADAVAKSNEALQQFAWIAAHDLQEPLRSVTGFLDLLEGHLPDQLDEKATHYVSRIKAAVGRMRNLITDLLAYSRVQTKDPKLKEVNLNELVANCLESLNGSIESTNASVQTEGLPTIVADESRIAQLFQNLIGNALKFRAPERKPIVSVTVHRLDNEWLFSIQDNGIGIDMQFAERIFIAFQRLSPHSSSGTGIGLAICKKIVEQHGGRIWIESVPGTGSTFSFTLRDRSEASCQS